MANPVDPLQAKWEQMVLAIGQANTTWSRIEHAMASLFEHLIGYSSDYVGLYIYFAPNNTETRFKIVDTAAMVKMANKEVPHDLQAEWQDVFAAISKAKDVRNQIAHGVIEQPGHKVRGTWVCEPRLAPSPIDLARRWRKHQTKQPRQLPGMSIRHVQATGNRFLWLAWRVEEISRYWQTYSMKWKEPPLPEIFDRILTHRKTGPPPIIGQTSPEPKTPPPVSHPKPKGPRPSAKQRRLTALAKTKLES